MRFFPSLLTAAAGVALLVAPATARAQRSDDVTVALQVASAQAVPARIAPDSLASPLPTGMPAMREGHRALLFGGGLLGGLVVAHAAGLGRGQSSLSVADGDRVDSKGRFPDKGVHFLGSAALTWAGLDLGVAPRHAVIAVCAAGAGLELVQRRVSRLDIVADCTGSAAAALWRWWWRGR